jgi:hypothetical protein
VGEVFSTFGDNVEKYGGAREDAENMAYTRRILDK